jgi:hypothetical protein
MGITKKIFSKKIMLSGVKSAKLKSLPIREYESEENVIRCKLFQSSYKHDNFKL